MDHNGRKRLRIHYSSITGGSSTTKILERASLELVFGGELVLLEGTHRRAHSIFVWEPGRYVLRLPAHNSGLVQYSDLYQRKVVRSILDVPGCASRAGGLEAPLIPTSRGLIKYEGPRGVPHWLSFDFVDERDAPLWKPRNS